MQPQVKEISLEDDDLFEEFELEAGNLTTVSKESVKNAEPLWEADWNDEKEKVSWAKKNGRTIENYQYLRCRNEMKYNCDFNIIKRLEECKLIFEDEFQWSLITINLMRILEQTTSSISKILTSKQLLVVDRATLLCPIYSLSSFIDSNTLRQISIIIIIVFSSNQILFQLYRKISCCSYLSFGAGIGLNLQKVCNFRLEYMAEQIVCWCSLCFLQQI
eukprot:TRINITY_DN874_c0_g1_i1.p1 TRINITY_DN874_c0_g1~~TRINITY_DN874_c0_g1_i1.p1  ORF type:complete len:218 (-),score=15.66 TRINITY_DN874_c0_g1_i1:169-822(-)